MVLICGTTIPLAPLGAAMAIHGADYAASGIYMAITGRQVSTMTSQLLQKTGMSREKADHWDDNTNFVSTLLGGGLVYKFAKGTASFYLSINRQINFINQEIRISNSGLTDFQERNLLSSAAKTYDQNLTQLAHSFSKHAGRHPETWGKLKGPINTWHDQALDQLKHIYHAPSEFKKVVDTKTGLTWIEKRLPDGRGIRLNQDYTFKGFVD